MSAPSPFLFAHKRTLYPTIRIRPKRRRLLRHLEKLDITHEHAPNTHRIRRVPQRERVLVPDGGIDAAAGGEDDGGFGAAVDEGGGGGGVELGLVGAGGGAEGA